MQSFKQLLSDMIPELIISSFCFISLMLLFFYRVEIFNFLWLDFIGGIACEIFEPKVLKLACGGWK